MTPEDIQRIYRYKKAGLARKSKQNKAKPSFQKTRVKGCCGAQIRRKTSQ
ncbi:hypothetical protein [Metabacillus arenae]|uniref:Uncharacterized protein n=1 Tax=Metabacillus arenae TaxID=2771434 RepID=A0A926N7V5_9BACI|nr:hypothetical protein [Metabacillus arenae]MBD1378997.1 hypothetical protein [Metabacillus arenae]